MDESNFINRKYSFLEQIKSKLMIRRIFDNLERNKFFNFIRYNKNIQNKLNLNLNDYKKEYSQIEIEIILNDNLPDNDIIFNFINIPTMVHQSNFIFYNNHNNKGIELNYINNNDGIKKINIIIDMENASLKKLFEGCQFIKKINFIKFNRKDINSDMSHMFDGCSLLQEINFRQFHSNNVIDMSYMFYGCKSLKKLNLSKFNTDKVENMHLMFYDCSSLKELDLSNFNTKNVKYMNEMFLRCSSLEKLNINNFKTYNVTDMSFMFGKCSSLRELNLSNFNTDKVTDMNNMFSQCSSLERLNLINFNTYSVINMEYMFNECSSLKYLNILNFNTNNITNTNFMFNDCSSLKELYCSDTQKWKFFSGNHIFVLYEMYKIVFKILFDFLLNNYYQINKEK